MAKERLDVLMVRHGFAESREKAQRLILAGEVTVAGQPASKPGHAIPEDSLIEVKVAPRFVSRGGEKLEGAFEAFGLCVSGQVCLDVGASTGGFTDCLLQHGAAHVYAVDVGRGQLHWKLRQDPRVTVLEQFNARYLKPGDLPGTPVFACVDVSFISLRLILPPLNTVLGPAAELVTLIKPQFEAGRGQVEEGGVVRDPAVRQQVVDSIREFGTATLGLTWLGSCVSPLEGPAGNVEFLAHWRKGA
jgi:23S rRNA (cytidine1920-2'-O)/16S rRNA (cytidine1409-2'-O)-methyltransferase